MEFVVIDKEAFENLNQRLERMEQMLLSITSFVKKKAPATKEEKEQIDYDLELSYWIPLSEAWLILRIDYNKWYRKHKKESSPSYIKHKSFDGAIRVYKPAIYKYLGLDYEG